MPTPCERTAARCGMCSKRRTRPSLPMGKPALKTHGACGPSTDEAAAQLRRRARVDPRAPPPSSPRGTVSGCARARPSPCAESAEPVRLWRSRRRRCFQKQPTSWVASGGCEALNAMSGAPSFARSVRGQRVAPDRRGLVIDRQIGVERFSTLRPSFSYQGRGEGLRSDRRDEPTAIGPRAGPLRAPRRPAPAGTGRSIRRRAAA